MKLSEGEDTQTGLRLLTMDRGPNGFGFHIKTRNVSCIKGAHRGSSKKSEKICVARWDYAIYKSSFSELSYVAFSQNSLSNSPRFASLAYSYFVVYISHKPCLHYTFKPVPKPLEVEPTCIRWIEPSQLQSRSVVFTHQFQAAWKPA